MTTYEMPIRIPDETPIDPHTARVKVLIKKRSTDLSEYLETRNRLVSAGCTNIHVYGLLDSAAIENLKSEDREVFFRRTTAYTRSEKTKQSLEILKCEEPLTEEQAIEMLRGSRLKNIVRGISPEIIKHFPELHHHLEG